MTRSGMTLKAICIVLLLIASFPRHAGRCSGTNRYEKNGFVEPLPALLPAIAIPGHDGSPG